MKMVYAVLMKANPIENGVKSCNRIVTGKETKICERKIETLKIKKIIPNHMAEYIEVIKTDMAKQILQTKKSVTLDNRLLCFVSFYVFLPPRTSFSF